MSGALRRLLSSIRGRAVEIWRWEPLRRSLTLYVVLRVGLSVWGGLVLAVIPVETGPDEVYRPYYDVPPVDRGLAGWLLGPWQRFDTLHYIHLALYGYEPGTTHTVFPPLYPLLIRWVGAVLGGHHMLAAMLISNLAAIGYFLLFYLLASEEVGRRAAGKGLLFAAIYPWSFVLLSAYTEPIFLVWVTLAFWLAQQGRGWAAGLCGALAALTRLSGALLALPLLWIALERCRFRIWPPRLDLLWPALPPLASLGFLAWRAWMGSNRSTLRTPPSGITDPPRPGWGWPSTCAIC